ncbi:hypothetical protein BX265_7586 [Streptomyces sp. TLI_235]|nr:hypothetical protein BX265_7586 [Streptomyces sp. TLI_235]
MFDAPSIRVPVIRPEAAGGAPVNPRCYAARSSWGGSGAVAGSWGLKVRR